MVYTPPTTASDVTSANGTTGTALATNKMANLADNDLVCLVAYHQLAGTTFSAPPSGFSSRYVAVASGTRGFQVWTKKLSGAGSAAAEPSSWGVTASQSTARWIMAAFRLPGMVGFDAAPGSDFYTTNASLASLPSVSAVSASTLALAFNFNNSSSVIFPAYSRAGWSNLLNANVTSGASTSVLDVKYKELTAVGATGVQDFTLDQAGASLGGFLLTLAITPTGPTVGMTSIGDLEYDRLKTARGISTPTVSLQDLREASYTPNDPAYFAGLSGLSPAQNYSLSDHKLAYYRGLAGLTSGSLADAMQEALN